MPASGREQRAGSSLRVNVVANYAGQLYAGLIGILMVPVYLRWLSAETYGLIGFFALLQSWSQLLDLGLSASISRQSSRYAGGELDAPTFRRLLRAFEWLFGLLGLALALGLAWRADLIASSWLHVTQLSTASVRHSIQLMAMAVGLRWVASLYRGVLSGVERQVWLNVFTAGIVTLRFVAVVPVVMAFDGSVVAFFAFQVLVAMAELAGLWLAAYRAAPVGHPVRLAGAWPLLGHALHFSAWAGVATIVWVFASHADKLVLSAVVPLADYGYFTAAVSAASVVAILSMAVSQALLPRLTQLTAQSDRAPLLALYRQMTQLTVAVGVPVALTLGALAQPVLWAWTGDSAFADRYAPVLSLYAAGNAFMLLAAFPYCLQHAAGDLRLHVWGNLLFSVAMVPLLLYVTTRHGALGAAWVWAGFNASFFLLWTPLVHRRFAPGLHGSWLLRDVVRVAALPCGLAALSVAAGTGASTSRLAAALWAGGMLVALTFAALCVTDDGRARLRALRTAARGKVGTHGSQTR